MPSDVGLQIFYGTLLFGWFFHHLFRQFNITVTFDEEFFSPLLLTLLTFIVVCMIMGGMVYSSPAAGYAFFLAGASVCFILALILLACMGETARLFNEIGETFATH